jgi:phosphinothricin acetyltransferase
MADIRLADAADLPAILDISNHYALTSPANFAVEPEPLDAWRDSWTRTHETHPWLVAVADGTVLGFAKASPWKGRCAYDHAAETSVYLHPEHLGHGLGRRLYETLFAMIEQQGYRIAIGGITLPNPASVALHEAMGMRRAALFERIGWKFGRWHDVGYWQRELGEVGAPGVIRAVAEVWDP